MSSIFRDGPIHFELAVTIARPRDDVFAYVCDLRRFPDWNSAVTGVVPRAGGSPAERYELRRTLPTGPATNELEVVARRPPEELVIRTTGGPTPFTYRYRFAADGPRTVLTLSGDVALGGAAALLGPLAAQGVKRGVRANLATLRDILERGG